MLKTAFTHYINNFRGFTREIWILAIITFINRAGTMVLPFLSKYLKEDLHFSYNQVGWIMVAFGFGSMLGSWLGGKLSDKIGFYKIMIFSLFTSGVSLFFVQYITTFWALCVAMFLLMTIADMFRPAMFVSLGAYAKPENRTRALTLVRLAVNLGFAAGPALGGLIIMGMGYSGLFWVDGASCIISISIFALLVKEKKKVVHDDKTESAVETKSVFHDKIFWVFLFVSFITAMIFFQLFTTLPLYHNEKFGLSEFQTGLLMTLNGLLIFSLEMPTVGFLERKAFPKIRIIIVGSFIMALSFFILLINFWAGILVVSMVCISIGEVLTFPFSNAFALSRAPRGQEGRYMALYTMSFSLAHIISSKVGFEIITRLGYQINWLFMACIGVIATGCCIWIKNALVTEKVTQ
ncbi:MFS transporter [Flavobacterium sp. Root935]|uniref:MDR family MFS transporter n=1 Tax=unclassified Flavobacterium TaxID=196869 RepID=UPI00070F6386|nr:MULTISPECIES: MFS transporter [unclassified Flavobacterium]KRD57597.1 MFS transporter [Flavobacterium sp. Root935]MDQ1165964.1 putative MFS family arabinose efflux permease [Flavobacterium sp. SORGH_AS_0622]TDX10226.1 putative MFS family arabinose efflux permease [Flavobacterium sp. S87F.05.LMB.W.Kidney.N]